MNPGCFLCFEAGTDNADLITRTRKPYTNEEYYASFKKCPMFLDTAVDKIHCMLQPYVDRINEIAEKLIRP
ncbi:MAG: hypothetical protein LBD86_02065 [Spirochaetaceae bacterium]|nr:hypothetical protein [Spirochaetaceae bacterium]